MISHALRLMMKQVDFMLLSLLALLLPAVQLTAQAHVRLINGGDYLGPAAVEAAANRLANELPNYDLRISYVLNFIPIADRYAVYDATRLLPFTAIPNPGEGFSAPSAAEKKAAFNTAIHHALSAVPAAGNTIHIVYATVVTLDAAGEEEVATKKYLHFGAGIRRLDRMKVKQVIPAPELEVLSGQAQNDAYLAAYVDELIEVLKDPDYPVTGTIRYEGQVYFHGDTIFMNYQQEEKIAAWAPESRTLTFSAKNAAAISPVTWTESHDYRQMLLTTEGLEVRARPYSTHFTHFTALTAHYGAGDSTTLYVMPINLQAVYAPAIVETHAPVPVHIEILNNHVPFELRGSGLLNVVPQRGNTIIPPVTFTPGMAPALDWQAAGACGVVPIWVNFVRPAQEAGTIAEMRFRVRVRCPFPLTRLVASSKPADEQLNGAFVRHTTDRRDTLFVVKPGGLVYRDRDIKIQLIHEGSDDEFWDFGDNPTFQRNDEPRYAVEPETPTDINPPNGNTVAVIAFGDAYPSTLPPYRKKTYKITASAFGDEEYVYVTFLSEERKEQTLNIPSIDDFVNNKMRGGLQRLNDWLGRIFDRKIGIEGSGLTGTRTAFNKEQEQGPDYRNVIEMSLAIGMGINSGNLVAPIPPYSGHLPFKLGWYGLYVNGSIGLQGAGEIAREKLHWENSYKVSTFTVEADIVGGLEAGIKIKLPPDRQRFVRLEIGAAISVPVEAKVKAERRTGDGWYLVGEFNWGPVYIGIPVQIALLPNSEYEWDLINMNFNWSLTNKIISPCQTPIINFND